MNTCPQCLKTSGIKTWEKRFSSRGNPVTCKLCGGFSHVLASSASGTFIVTAFLFVVAVLAGAVSNSWLAGLSACLLAAAYNQWAWQREALSPILKENVQAARRANWVVAALYFVIALFS
jgi:hypothetical protein